MAPSLGEDVTAAVEVRSVGELQAQLRALSYSEPVGVESVPLVRRLLRDLVGASTAREKAEHALEKAQRDALEFSQVLLPLRKENAQLTRENNSLHLEIIHQEEAVTEREKACELQLEGLRDDVKKLQFLIGQKTQQCAKKEQEVAKLQAQLERVLATGGGGGGGGAGLSSPSMEMRGSDASQSLRRLSMDSQQARKTQQALVATDLQQQLADVARENATLHAQVAQFHDKLRKREQEIERLAKLSVQVVGDQDASARKLQDLEERYQTRARQDAADLQVEQLGTQVDILNDQVAKYESRLKEATEQIRRNGGLAEKLQQAELDREHFVKELSVLQAKHHVLEEEHARCINPHAEPGNPPAPLSPGAAVNPPEAEGEEEEQNADEESLKEQVQTLTTHKDRLEDALRAMHYDKISYTNALSNANSHNRVLTSDLARAEAKVKELTVEKTKLEQSLADARTSLDANLRELDVLRESLKQSEDNSGLDKEKNASLHRELRSMDKLLSQRDDECRSLNHALTIQKGEVERLTGKIERLEAAASGADGEDAVQDGRKAVFAQEMKWLEEERHDLRREKEGLMLQVMTLEEDLQKANASLQEAKHEKEKLLERNGVASKMQANAEGMLETKKRECADVQRQLVEAKDKVRELTDKQNQAQVLLSRAEETENEKLVVQNEALALKRHVEELRDQNASLKNRVENDDLYGKRLSDQIQKLQTEAAVASKKCSTLEKEKEEVQSNYDSAMVELRNARQTWNHYQNEFEKLSKEVQAQQHSLSSGQSALQSSQSSVSDLRNQVRQLQSEMKLKQNNSHQLETRLEQEKTSHKTVQTQLVLLQDELLQVKETNRAREIALKQLRAEIQTKDRALTEKTEAVENFKLLIEQMESSRDQMVFQTKQRQQQIQRHQQEMDGLNAKISSLESEVSAKDSEISSLKKLTRTLDSEKDTVNDQLDVLTEKYHELEKQSNELRKLVQDKNSDATGLQEQMGNLVNKLNEAEDRLSKLQDHCSQLESEVDRLEHLKGMHTAELAALAQDLENMTIENQAISEECARLQHVELSHSQSTKNMKQTTREIERERDTLQIELEDLRHTYRSLIQEHEGMQKARAEISSLQEELAVVNESLRKQVASLDNQTQTLREKNVTLTTEAATYRDQVSFLTEKLQSSEEKQDNLQTRMHQLVQELEAQKQVSTEISAQRYGAQAENAAVSQRIVHLEAKLSNCKYEMKSLQDKLHAEQSQRRSLEEVASTLRQKIATNDNLISHLEEQRDAMAQEIQASHQRQVSVSTPVMNMSELNHTPPSASQSSRASERRQSHVRAEHLSPPPSPSRSSPSDAVGSTPESGGKASSSSSYLPLHALEEAQMKCQELEDRLAQQDNTIKQLERSRSKFKRFAAKYEREIEQRDRRIEELQSSSHASSFVSPDARSFRKRILFSTMT
ncbi:Centrosomal protein [Phytophthora cinnamomi]|uniref:Centrosomal protein n=1 Tax=Phytophthora cinnamomi TaxID=4785 RepID=UPI00355AA5C1|nr:Centrosomal protein [Phytophthora cinnamomi]